MTLNRRNKRRKKSTPPKEREVKPIAESQQTKPRYMRFVADGLKDW